MYRAEFDSLRYIETAKFDRKAYICATQNRTHRQAVRSSCVVWRFFVPLRLLRVYAVGVYIHPVAKKWAYKAFCAL